MTEMYEIVIRRSVLKGLRRIPRVIAHAIQAQIFSLKKNPFPPGCTPIRGYDHCYRIRIGQYRVIYEVAATIRIITVIRIGHRKNVYRNL